MDVHLYERRIADALETVYLPRLDDENVSSSGFKFLAVDHVFAAPFTNELDFVVRVAVGVGA